MRIHMTCETSVFRSFLIVNFISLVERLEGPRGEEETMACDTVHRTLLNITSQVPRYDSF